MKVINENKRLLFTLKEKTSGSLVIAPEELILVEESLNQTTPVDPRPYKVYTALLTQTGTNAPVATVLENTLGGEVVWTRDIEGLYYGSLTGAFTNEKTLALISGILSQGDSFSVGAGRLDTNNIYISSKSLDPLNANTPIFKDLITEAPLSIEIRVYN